LTKLILKAAVSEQFNNDFKKAVKHLFLDIRQFWPMAGITRNNYNLKKQRKPRKRAGL